MISMGIVAATKVRFLKPLHEDDFVEKGMVAWLTDIEWDGTNQCYQLWFDFTDFEEQNKKYFKEIYHPNIHTHAISTTRSLFTALEAGQYSPKYSAYFSIPGDKRDDAALEKELATYLREIFNTPQ